MNFQSKVKKAAKNPLAVAILLLGFEKFKFISDKMYISVMYKYYIGKKLNLENPRTFNEKLQWLKLYNRKDVYTIMVDKYKVRDYVSKKIGEEHLIPLLGAWDRVDEIDFDALPNEFVIKCNHNSGTGMCICKNKVSLNIENVKKGLQKGLRENYYYLGREWPYKNVKRKIIAEKFMVDESGCELKDYKVLCFNGEPKLIQLHQGRFTTHQSQDYYDMNWNKTDISQGKVAGFGCSDKTVPKPSCFNEMIQFSRILSKGIPQVRIDWYIINDQLYFGEITFFDGCGFDGFDDPNDDVKLGSWIDLQNL